MLLQNQTWPQIEKYLETKKTIILPIGSTEQHGPTGLIGTDFLTSNALAQELGKQTSTLVSPPLCFGMAEHHMAFPGTISFKPSTYSKVLFDIFESLDKHGFENLFVINGHGGNIIPFQHTTCEWKASHDSLNFYLESWWRMPEVQAYEDKHFGEENGFHATCGEVALTMYTEEEAFKNITAQNFKVEKKDTHPPLSASEFRHAFPDGRMFSNPGLASKEHGKALFEIAISALKQRLEKI